MASANLELVRSICTAWERGDYSSAEWADPEIDFARPDGPEPGRWIGLTRMAEYWRQFLGNWQHFRSAPESYHELDGEQVLVFAHLFGRGKTSALELGQTGAKGAILFHVRGGRVTRLALYFDRDRALADLGLASEADPS